MEKKWYHIDDVVGVEFVGVLELSVEFDYNYFMIVKIGNKLVFGNATNIELLQSGFMPINDDFSLDENLQELNSELETYYRDGYRYCTNILCNDRM